MRDHIKKNKDIKEDDERQAKKTGEKKENSMYLCFIVNIFNQYTVLFSNF